MANETKTLRVKPQIALPHEVSYKGVKYVASPDATFPLEYAESLLKSQPHIWEPAVGKPDLSKYNRKPEFTKATVVDLVNSLDMEQLGKVVKFIGDLKQAELKAAEDKKKGDDK